MKLFSKKKETETTEEEIKTENSEEKAEEKTEDKETEKKSDKESDKGTKEKTSKSSANQKSIYSNKPQKEDLAVILKWAAPMIALLVVWGLVRYGGNVINNPNAVTIAQQVAKGTELKNSIDIKTNEYKDLQSQEAVINEFAYYNGDTSKDDEIAVKFFEHICTWNNSVMYESLREELLNEGYMLNDSVMTVLLPETETYFNEKAGKWQNSIDVKGENLKFESLTTYPVSVSESKRSYAGILEVSLKDNSDDGMNKEYFGNVFVSYVIENGKCCEVEAVTLME